MLDAETSYPNDVMPAAVRLLVPELWRSSFSLDSAITAGTADAADAVSAFADQGRWIVRCPDCPSAQLTAQSDPRFMCIECANSAIGNLFRPVEWPDDPGAIAAALELRPRMENRNWAPPETVADLLAENAANGVS